MGRHRASRWGPMPGQAAGRPGALTLAATLLLIAGVLGAGYAGLGLASTGRVADVARQMDRPEPRLALYVAFLAVLLLLHLAQIVAGAGVLGLRRRAWTTGLVSSAVTAMLWLVVLIASIVQGLRQGGLLLGLLWIVGGVAVVALLLPRREPFRR